MFADDTVCSGVGVGFMPSQVLTRLFVCQLIVVLRSFNSVVTYSMCVHCNICHQYAVSCTSVDHYYIHVVSYNMSLIHYIADMPTRGQLRSLSSGHLDIRQSCLVTVGDRSFITAAL